jgi:hypothetical protein
MNTNLFSHKSIVLGAKTTNPRVEFFFDKPIHVPRETLRLQLETALKSISRD